MADFVRGTGRADQNCEACLGNFNSKTKTGSVLIRMRGKQDSTPHRIRSEADARAMNKRFPGLFRMEPTAEEEKQAEFSAKALKEKQTRNKAAAKKAA